MYARVDCYWLHLLRCDIGRLSNSAPAVSQQLDDEIQQYKDIVVLDVPDTYNELVSCKMPVRSCASYMLDTVGLGIHLGARYSQRSVSHDVHTTYSLLWSVGGWAQIMKVREMFGYSVRVYCCERACPVQAPRVCMCTHSVTA